MEQKSLVVSIYFPYCSERKNTRNKRSAWIPVPQVKDTHPQFDNTEVPPYFHQDKQLHPRELNTNTIIIRYNSHHPHENPTYGNPHFENQIQRNIPEQVYQHSYQNLQ